MNKLEKANQIYFKASQLYKQDLISFQEYIQLRNAYHKLVDKHERLEVLIDFFKYFGILIFSLTILGILYVK